MDNIGDILQSVLSDPEAMAKLKETARQLGLDTEQPAASANSTQNMATAPASSSANTGINTADFMSAMGSLVPMLGKLQEDDDMSRLIHALKPFLSGNRLKKAEEADKIMMLLRLIPLLQNARQDQSSQ